MGGQGSFRLQSEIAHGAKAMQSALRVIDRESKSLARDRGWRDGPDKTTLNPVLNHIHLGIVFTSTFSCFRCLRAQDHTSTAQGRRQVNRKAIHIINPKPTSPRRRRGKCWSQGPEQHSRRSCPSPRLSCPGAGTSAMVESRVKRKLFAQPLAKTATTRERT